MIRPQLAYDLHGDFDLVPVDGWVMEPKLDGWRWQVMIEIDDVGRRVVRSVGGRNGKEHPTPRGVVDALSHLPVGTILDGEMIHGNLSSDVTHGMATGAATKFVAFDILAVAGKDVCSLPWMERRELLEEALPLGVLSGTGAAQTIPTSPVDREVYERWLEIGLEGIVAKRMDAPYRPGTRRRDGFLKVKPNETTDVIVTGWEYGKGASNTERCGNLQVTLIETGQPTTVGFDASVEKANGMVGRRCEIKHWGKMKSGKVRHPTFLRLRPDLEEDEALPAVGIPLVGR